MRILVFQHAYFEHAGRLRDQMRERGVAYDVVALDEGEAIPALEGYQGLLILGGPMGPMDEKDHPWLQDEKKAIREAVIERDLAVLGICLGHQLLAVALGGEVGQMSTSEVGICPYDLTEMGRHDGLFRGVAGAHVGLQWHGWEVTRMPQGTLNLARSEITGCQAMRAGPRAWGVQFHIETFDGTLSEWTAPPENEAALEEIMGEGARARFVAEANAAMPRLNADSRIMFDNFLNLASAPTEDS